MMAIMRKTEAGQQALQAREGGTKLPVRLRTLLLQVDGQKNSEQLVQLAVSLGSPAETVDKLLELGLIEPLPGSVVEPPAPSQREIAAAAMATVAVTIKPAAPTPPLAAPPVVSTAPVVAQTAAPVATPATAAVDDTQLEDIPVSTKLPEHLRPVAALMRQLVEKHLGLKAMLLKRRISHCDDEKELRLALVALREAMAKASNNAQADAILQEVYTHLPMIGLNRAKTF
ncbi:hypothetical protein GCM10007907_21330 [Chitinimonas prasina]|uniref:DUF3102 domain-containing protein n=1 Tax=Chitinimonas prasina TaxID=1434937 RepID=A0ABQ5YI35_9NEIS|nr:hypothetical protein [Chitinimonas prasina]GLR13343.1 hypothetical protein GCM10007907_21330 [Chitinimonas prasina]